MSKRINKWSCGINTRWMRNGVGKNVDQTVKSSATRKECKVDMKRQDGVIQKSLREI